MLLKLAGVKLTPGYRMRVKKAKASAFNMQSQYMDIYAYRFQITVMEDIIMCTNR